VGGELVQGQAGLRRALADLVGAEPGDLAAQHGLTIHELYEDRASLEEAFMELTRDSVEYHADAPTSHLSTEVAS
jgi:hypothetical protein